jgi:sensor histidine kinase YesM
MGVVSTAKTVKRREQHRSPFGSWLAILAIPLCSIVILYNVFCVDIVNKDVGNLIIIVIATLIMNIVAFVLYDYLENSFAVKAENLILSKQVGYYTEHFKSQIEYAESVSVLKHDLKNHIIALKSLLDGGKCEAAQKHIDSLLEQTNSVKAVNTNNFTIDAIINYKLNYAATRNISCRTSLKIPQQLMLNSEDACVLLGNLLDNAIEASLKIETDRRFISIKMTYDKGNLYILVSNAYDGGELMFKGEKLQTTKENKSEHGIGLNSVSLILKKYNSNLNVSVDIDKKIFTAESLLYGVNVE